MTARGDLWQLLGEHLDWMEASTGRFDAGHFSEYKRLAVIVRTLVHQTDQSSPLLSQLGIRDSMTWLSAIPREPEFESNLWSFVPSDGGFIPSIGTRFQPESITFETWWNMPVVAAEPLVSRRLLVLGVANLEGGAHVSEQLDPAWTKLTRDGGYQSTRRNSEGRKYFDLSNPVPSALRTIAAEVIQSLERES